MRLTDYTETGRERLKLMTLEYTNVSEGNFLDEPVVELFCRDESGERRRVNVHDYYPHFYITEEEFASMKEDLLQEQKVRYIEVDKRLLTEEDTLNGAIHAQDSPPRTTLEGKDLVRIYTVVPGDISDLREEFGEHWEADVFFTNRFLIDSDIKLGLSVPAGKTDVSFDEIEILEAGDEPDIRPRMLTVDIEVWSGGNFPDTQNPKKPVTAITAHDTYDDEYFCGVLHPDAVDRGDGHSWPEEPEWKAPDGIEDDQLTVNTYYEEVKLLGDFNNFVVDKDPDLLTGWNSSRNDIGSGFDYPYIINRCERINEWGIQDVAYGNGRSFVTNRGTPVIGGREMFDMLQAYKKTQIHEKRSYSLGYIAEEELGYGKEDIESLDEGWLHEPVEFMRYNIRDTQAVVEIEQSKNVLEMYDHIRSITGATYSEIADSNIGIIDLLFLRSAKEKGYALPTSERPDTQHYWGAYVFDPEPGKHKNVVYPDLSSLYPNLFRDMNASPETIIGDEANLAESDYSKDDCHTIYVDPRDEDVKKDADEPKRSELYVLKPDVKESFVREVIDDLIQLKYKYKSEEYADEAYAAAKRITNSCFTPDTEVMTPDGIKKITDVEVGDDVYSWNVDSGEMEVKSVTETIERPDYDGEIIHIENNTIDLKVTPDHRMCVKRSRHSDEWEVTDAGNLNEWTQYELPSHENVTSLTGERINRVDILDFYSGEYDKIENDGKEFIRKNNKSSIIPRYIDGDKFMKLIGWYAAEGHSRCTGDNTGYQSIFCQKNKSGREKISELLSECNINFISDKNGHIISNEIFTTAMDTVCGVGSENKRLPEMVLYASKEQRQILLNTLENADGDSDTDRNRYSTKSKELRDDFLQLITSLGMDGEYRYDDGGELNTGVWRIHYGEKKKTFRMTRSGDRNGDGAVETAENGVYCVQVEDNHTLVAGRNGKFSHIPQCYGVMGDSVSYGKGFRLFDWRIAEAITLAGRDVIKHTADKFESRVQSLGYSDAQIISGDSVPAEEPIICKRDGSVSVEQVRDISVGDMVWSDTGFTKVKDVIKKPNRKQCYSVRTQTGIVHTTEDHGLLRDDGTEVTPEELDVGDQLMHNDIGNISLPQDREISEDEAWLLGVFCADGSAGIYETGSKWDDYKSQVKVSNQETDILKKSIECFEDCYNFSMDLYDDRESSNVFNIKPHENEKYDIIAMAARLRQWCYTEDGSKRVPEKVLNASKSSKRRFLDGFHAADGHIESGNYEELKEYDEMWSKSPVLLQGIVLLLRDMDIDVSLSWRNNHNSQYYRARCPNFRKVDSTKCREIEAYEYTGDYVYDLETENHHFGAGIGSIIVHNTDSCVCKVPSADDMDETLSAAQQAADYVDSTYDDFMVERFNMNSNNMAVEIESYAESALFMDAKKRYAQWVRWDEGDAVDEVEYKGFELVRSDSAAITAEVQRGVLDRILKEESPHDAVSEYLEAEWNDVLNGDVNLDALGTPSAINNELMDYGWSEDDDTGELKYFTPQPHIRGARYAKCYIEGEDISQGSKPLMFYVDGVQPTGSLPETYAYDDELSLNAPQDKPDANKREMKEIDREVDAIAVEDVRSLTEDVKIDYEKMADKTVRGPVEPIIKVMGWNFDDLVTEGQQTGIAQYM